MVLALIATIVVATIVVATSVVVTTVWIAYRGVLARLDNMAAQQIIDRRRAQLTSPTPEQRRAKFHLIRGGAVVAALGASAWLLDQTRGIGTRAALAAAGSSALLLGGAEYASETVLDPITLPVITEDAPVGDDHDTEIETAIGDTMGTPPKLVEPVTPSPDAPTNPDPSTDRGHIPAPDATDDLPPPEPEESERKHNEDPPELKPSPSQPQSGADPPPDPDDSPDTKHP